MHDINEQIPYTGQYFPTNLSLHKCYSQGTKRFRQEHLTEIKHMETAARYLKTKTLMGKMPSMKHLKTEKEKLLTQKMFQYGTYRYFKDYQQELRTVFTNVDTILGKEPVRTQENGKNLNYRRVHNVKTPRPTTLESADWGIHYFLLRSKSCSCCFPLLAAISFRF